MPSCLDSFRLLLVGAVFAVGFTLGVGSVICFNPFSEGFAGLASGRLGTGTAGYAIGRNLWDPLDVDVTLCSDVGGRVQFDLEAPEGGDEKWQHAVVVGISPSNALWVLTPGRSIEEVGGRRLRGHC